VAAPGEVAEHPLVRLLDVEALAADRFRGGTQETGLPQVYGGHVVAQALLAAARTVRDDRLPHSLHGYFLRPATPTRPVVYEVRTVREGGSFSTRSVTGRQDDADVITVLASFCAPEPGLEHQVPGPAAAGPETSVHLPENALRQLRWDREFSAWDIRPLRPGRSDDSRPALSRTWVRLREPLPDDPLLHAVALAYASDLTLLETNVRPHGRPFVRHGLRLASLDHGLWFHRPCRADEWLLVENTSATTARARGLASGRFFTADGVLVATVVQEGLIRQPRSEVQAPAAPGG
jgi:acyl-CoA thioesterase-2